MRGGCRDSGSAPAGSGAGAPSGTSGTGAADDGARSAAPGEVWVTVGAVSGAHGVRGEVRLRPETDFPERLRPGRRLLLRRGGESRWTQVLGVRAGRAGELLLRLEGVSDRDGARALGGWVLQVPAEDLEPLPPGTYYVHQIIGLEVRLEDGGLLGRVVAVERTGANDVYVVSREGGEPILLPATREVVRGVDLSAGRMTVRLLPGLLEDRE